MKPLLSAIIPILNEEKLLIQKSETLIEMAKYFKKMRVPFLIVDAGSTDLSKEVLKGLELKYIECQIQAPSVARTILQAREMVESEYLWVLPLDCEVKDDHLLALLKELEAKSELSYGAFTKSYDSSSVLLTWQMKYLNGWRLKMRSQFVWTNCPFVKTSIFFKELPKNQLFLSDIYLSQALKRLLGAPLIINRPIVCSSRRYLTNGVLKQILKNLLVLCGHRLGLSPQVLRKVYR